MTRQPMFNVPASVLGALALLVLVHVGRGFLPVEQDWRFVLAMAFVPARYAAGAPALPGDPVAAVSSFLTYMVVHGDAVHLTVNAIWMLAFGSAVARRAGNLRFLAFSALCGIAGVLVHLAVHFGALVPVVGASAAISGQMAAAIRFVFSGTSAGPFAGDLRLVPLAPIAATLKDGRILAFIGIWAALNALLGLGVVNIQGAGAGIAWEAHLGGFLFGLFSYGLFDGFGRADPPPPAAVNPQ